MQGQRLRCRLWAFKLGRSIPCPLRVIRDRCIPRPCQPMSAMPPMMTVQGMSPNLRYVQKLPSASRHSITSLAWAAMPIGSIIPIGVRPPRTIVTNEPRIPTAIDRRTTPGYGDILPVEHWRRDPQAIRKAKRSSAGPDYRNERSAAIRLVDRGDHCESLHRGLAEASASLFRSRSQVTTLVNR